jgi:hypothetical protein
MTVGNTIPTSYTDAEMIWWEIVEFRNGRAIALAITSYFEKGIIVESGN